MPANISVCPKIEVRYWDASQVCVKCPYCEELHRHGTALPGIRKSHCGSRNCSERGTYELILPIDEKRGLIGYEIDKRKARFANVSIETDKKDLEEPSEAEDSELADLFCSRLQISESDSDSDSEPDSERLLSFEEDSAETVAIPLPDGPDLILKKIVRAVGKCIEGDMGYITQYLRTTTEANIFLQGRG